MSQPHSSVLFSPVAAFHWTILTGEKGNPKMLLTKVSLFGPWVRWKSIENIHYTQMGYKISHPRKELHSTLVRLIMNDVVWFNYLSNTLCNRICTRYQEEFKEELDITLKDLTISWKTETGKQMFAVYCVNWVLEPWMGVEYRSYVLVWNMFLSPTTSVAFSQSFNFICRIITVADYSFSKWHKTIPIPHVTWSCHLSPPEKGGINFSAPLNLTVSWDCFDQQNMVGVTLPVLDIAHIHLVWQISCLAFLNTVWLQSMMNMEFMLTIWLTSVEPRSIKNLSWTRLVIEYKNIRG